MKQISIDHSTIAWFKLAECISRGEKERALGIYRLLSHSFNDAAVALQLEGDIYLAFDNHAHAVEQYGKAVELYKKEQRLLQAAAVLEHFIVLEPDIDMYRKDLTALYHTLGIQSKLCDNLIALVEAYLEAKKWEQAAGLLEQYAHIDPVTKITIQEKIALSLLQHDTSNTNIESYITSVIEGLLAENRDTDLQQFLLKIQAIDVDWYKRASAYIKREK